MTNVMSSCVPGRETPMWMITAAGISDGERSSAIGRRVLRYLAVLIGVAE